MTTTLRAIRKRLNSVRNTQQLTKAMEMVAASHLHRAQARMQYAHQYFAEIKKILMKLNWVGNDMELPLLKQREVKKIAVVIVAGKMGLCGSYNQDVFNSAQRFLESVQHKDVELILIGRMATNHFNRLTWPIRLRLFETEERPTVSEVVELANQLMEWYLSGNVDEVWFVHTKYVNIMSRQVLVDKWFSVEDFIFQEQKEQPLDYLFEPKPQHIYNELLFQYCLAKIQIIFNEAYASELAARIFAMKTATTNAEEMVEKLTLVRNRVRQAGITKEMLEISSGAEGLK